MIYHDEVPELCFCGVYLPKHLTVLWAGVWAAAVAQQLLTAVTVI